MVSARPDKGIQRDLVPTSRFSFDKKLFKPNHLRQKVFTEHYNGLMGTRLTCVIWGDGGGADRYLPNLGPVIYSISSSTGGPWPDRWWASHTECVHLWIMTCTCTPCNPTLFKQTEDSARVETVIIWANTHPPRPRGSFISHSRVWGCEFFWRGKSGPNKHRKTGTSGTGGTLFQRPQCDIKHSGPVYSARGTFTAPQSKSPLFFSLFAWNSSQVCNMEQWLLAHGVITVAPLCAGVHRIAAPTLHSWNPLVTAEWPEAGQVTPKQGGKKHNFLCVLQQTLIPGWGRQWMNHCKFPMY